MASISNGESGSSVRTKLNAALPLTPVTSTVGNSVLPKKYLGNRTDGLRLHKVIEELEAGTRTVVNVLSVGDSFASGSQGSASFQIIRLMTPFLNSTPVYFSGIAGLEAQVDVADQRGGAAVSSLNENVGFSTAAFISKVNYDIVTTGTYVEIASGEVANFSNGGVNLYCDRIVIPIYTATGAGTVKIEIADSAVAVANADGAWRNPTGGEVTSGPALTGSELLVSADAAAGVTLIVLDVALSRWGVKLTHTSGSTVNVGLPMHQVRTAAAVNVWRIAEGSNGFQNETTAGAAVLSDIIASYNPDIIIVDSDDDTAAYTNFLPKLETAITDAGLTLNPLVLLPQAPYSAGSETALRARADYCEDFCQTRMGWDVIDGTKFSGGYAEALDASWHGDGVHYQDPIAWRMLWVWAVQRGYIQPMLRKPGGDASSVDVISFASDRYVTSSKLLETFVRPSRRPTAHLTWANGVTGTGSVTAMGANSYLRLSSGFTAGSTAVSYINSDATALGLGRYISAYDSAQNDTRGVIWRASSVITPTSDYTALLTCRSDVAHNAAYDASLGGVGFGFRLDGGTFKGICWTGSAEAVSAETVTLTANTFFDAFVILHPASVNVNIGVCEWWFRDPIHGLVKLGESNYRNGFMYGPRAEISNGAAAEDFRFDVAYPDVISI